MEIRNGRAERDQGTVEVETRTEERNEGTGGGDSGTQAGGTEGRKRKRKAEGKRGETIPELASVAEPDPVPVRVPGSDDVEVPAPEKPKRKKGGRKKKSAGSVDTTQVAALIQSFSKIAATRLGDHWVFSDEEALSIAEPLSRIMERHGVTEKLGEYADYIALLSAVTITVVPRMMVTREMAKREKPGVKGVIVHGDQKTRNEGRTGTGGTAGATGAGANSAYVPSDVKRAVAQLVQPF